MAHLDTWKPFTAAPMTSEELRLDLRAFFWVWFEEHKRDMILSKTILFWSLKIYVEDLRFLFVQLFGENPYA